MKRSLPGNTNEDSRKMTIGQQIYLLFLAIILLILLLFFAANTIWLEKYYRWNKEKALQEAYSSINEAASSEILESDQYDIEWQRICSKYNLSCIVLDEDSEMIKCTNSDAAFMIRQLMDYFFNLESVMKTRDIQILKTEKNYCMQITRDSRVDSEYLELWGILENGNPFMIRSAIAGIHDSAEISMRFLAYAGIAAMLAGVILISLFSRHITKPILRLAGISERMRALDFNAKFEGQGVREIELLGRNINALSETLERTISELKEANNELQVDIAKKEQIDAMRREFLSNVSHELKTPIALIQGYAEGLKDGITEDPESMDYYCDVIIDESAKMNALVQKLMTLNQLEFGADPVRMERFDVVELIGEFLRSADILIRQNNASLTFLINEPIYVWADRFKTEEVFRNYFSNALNHLDGERRVEINIERKEELVRISVFNNGERIPEESLPRLWDKFYKVDKARTREYGGSGVGLSIVKAIMDSFHRSYGVYNVDNGVVFWFELDAKESV